MSKIEKVCGVKLLIIKRRSPVVAVVHRTGLTKAIWHVSPRGVLRWRP